MNQLRYNLNEIELPKIPLSLKLELNGSCNVYLRAKDPLEGVYAHFSI